MSRENAATKGRRLLVEGRLLVERVDGNAVRATCRGDSGAVYRLGHDGAGWFCDCAARSTCSHLRALMLVTVRRAA
jgi:hypothetical protein